jgi:hypothetical protein
VQSLSKRPFWVCDGIAIGFGTTPVTKLFFKQLLKNFVDFCHLERSERSLICNIQEILRFAQNDNLFGNLTERKV